jgi:hypothetical protein
MCYVCGMSHQYFIDRATISNVRRTLVGGLLLDATLAKVGVMDYVDGKNGLVRRYNPPSALSEAATAVVTAPVTHGHPAKFVDIHSYGALSKGHVVGTPTFVDGHIKATLAINDAALIRAIEMGQCREVSMGYAAYHDGVAGVTESGEAYDESRIKIEWNHIAIVPAGRAGKTVRLMLDSAEIPQEDEENMSLKINGVEVKAEGAQAAFDTFEAGLQVVIADLNRQLTELKTAKEAADAKVAELSSDAALDARVDARVAAQAAATAKADKLAKVKAAYPGVSLDGRSDEFVDGLFAGLETKPTTDAAGSDPEGLNRLNRPATVNKDQSKPKPVSSQDAYQKMRAEERAASHAKVVPSEV